MTSWIWMKGVDVAIADPIAVEENDDRPSIKALVLENRDKIDKLKKQIAKHPLYEGDSKHDDLWILRFLLSHKKKLKPSLKAAETALMFRKEHKFDDTDIRAYPVGPTAKNDALQRYLAYCKDDAF